VSRDSDYVRAARKGGAVKFGPALREASDEVPPVSEAFVGPSILGDLD